MERFKVCIIDSEYNHKTILETDSFNHACGVFMSMCIANAKSDCIFMLIDEAEQEMLFKCFRGLIKINN